MHRVLNGHRQGVNFPKIAIGLCITYHTILKHSFNEHIYSISYFNASILSPEQGYSNASMPECNLSHRRPTIFISGLCRNPQLILKISLVFTSFLIATSV
jgi:hypothetical protein